MEDEMIERVKRGAALLDEKRPGWTQKIRLDRLGMSKCDHCILGQVFGDYVEGMEELGMDEMDCVERLDRPDLLDSGEHGFCSAYNGSIEYPILADLWRDEVRARTTEAVPC